MTFIWTDDQRAVRDSLRALLEKTVELTPDGVAGATNAVAGTAWQRLADEVGAQAIGIPEEHGGVGFGFDEQAVVFAESGRVLGPRGLFSTVALAVPALLLSGDTGPGTGLLATLADGSRAATVAVTDSAGSEVTAAKVGNTWRLSGARRHVTDAAEVGLIITPATVGSQTGLFAVDASADGLSVGATHSVDSTRPLGDIRLDEVAAELIGDLDSGAALLAQVRDRAVVALAFEQVAGAQRCLEMASEYATTRKQFGREIGSFQSIKHLLADVLVAVECAAAATQHAASVVDTGDGNLPYEAAVAGLLASEAYTKAAGVNIQVHGGIGFTWEHPAHLYFKRAAASRAFLGSPTHHRETLAAHAFA